MQLYDFGAQSLVLLSTPTVGFLGEERVLQRLRGVRGQDDATETRRRATPQRIVDIVRNRTLK